MPNVTPATPRFQRRPFGLMAVSIPVGVNVYKLTDGSYVEEPPADQSTIAVTYHGGHSHDVTVTEAAALTAAGYGANLT